MIFKSLSSFLSLTNRPRNFVNRSPSRNDVREISLKLPPLSGQRITCQLSTSNKRAPITRSAMHHGTINNGDVTGTTFAAVKLYNVR